MLKKTLYFLIVLVLVSCASAGKEPADSTTTAVPSATKDNKTPAADDSASLSTAKREGDKERAETTETVDETRDHFMAGEIAPRETAPGTGKTGPADFDRKSDGMIRDGAGGASAAERPSSSGLKAGFEDDNKQFNYFINFLHEYSYVPHHGVDVGERILFRLLDIDGMTIPNADIIITAPGEPVAAGKTHPDGTFQFNPSEIPNKATSYSVGIKAPGLPDKKIRIDRNGPREIIVNFAGKRSVPEPIPVDILFIMDTTGSMGEEIDRLKLTIELIHLNLSSLSNDLVLRFGMVLYKDRGDIYITDTIPLTADLESFQDQLALVSAEGGGDYPEDLQAALDETIHGIQWSGAANAIKLAYLITDATPHLDYADQQFSYADAMKAARRIGLKIHTIGTGGLDVNGEYILRQIAQYTGGKYIFLTYGESGESSGGTIGSVSHHTGANYQTDKFESIIIRFSREEIAWLSSTPLPADDPYLEALRIESEEREETLNKLFAMSLTQLVSFSSYTISPEDSVAVLPILDETGNAETAEYFTQQLVLGAAKNDSFTLVERADLNVLIEEMTLQLSGLTEGKGIEEIGNVLEADYLLTSRMYEKGGKFELFMKFLRVKTGEVVSVTKAKLDKKLGL
ncbi:MAG: VWA domain-containing protein [Spirochaetales bacterium]|nr:VWA domain-containing protein [Spirochaetales bacterium]